MVTRFTPGPWKVRASPHGRRYRCVQIGADPNYTTLEMEPADARLIAAGPDLLESLKMLLDQCERVGMTTRDDEPFLEAARAAIAKATGEVK